MRIHILPVLALALALAACGGESTAPASEAARSPFDPASWSDPARAEILARAIADSAGTFGPSFDHWSNGSSGLGEVVACTRRQPATSNAVIGPRGGILVVGPNALIVPPGAVLTPTLISAQVIPDTVAGLRFQPHGLVFNKPAGLVMNSSGCEIPPGEWPAVLYVEHGVVTERIPSIYSPWWHAVAAPLRHFSGYMIGL